VLTADVTVQLCKTFSRRHVFQDRSCDMQESLWLLMPHQESYKLAIHGHECQSDACQCVCSKRNSRLQILLEHKA
jgi:hypothetical protein